MDLMSEQIRRMTAADLPAAIALKEAAGWNQTEQDWRLLLDLQPDGCFVLEVEGQVAASATAYLYGSELAWIGMVLTLPEHRGRGFGNRVFTAALDFCRQRRVRTIKLDATDMGKPLYERAGFVGEYEVERWGARAPGGSGGDAQQTKPLTERQLADLFALDRRAFGVSRDALLRALLARAAWTGGADGFALGRPGAKAAYFGPCVAARAILADQLIERFLGDHASQPVFVDIPKPNVSARRILSRYGFDVRRTLLRMYLGPNDQPGDSSLIFGLAGFEYG